MIIEYDIWNIKFREKARCLSLGWEFTQCFWTREVKADVNGKERGTGPTFTHSVAKSELFCPQTHTAYIWGLAMEEKWKNVRVVACHPRIGVNMNVQG